MSHQLPPRAAAVLALLGWTSLSCLAEVSPPCEPLRPLRSKAATSRCWGRQGHGQPHRVLVAGAPHCWAGSASPRRRGETRREKLEGEPPAAATGAERPRCLQGREEGSVRVCSQKDVRSFPRLPALGYISFACL